MNYSNRNFLMLIFVLIFQEFFWLGLFSFTISDTFTVYQLIPIEFSGILIVFLCCISVFAAMLVMRRIKAKIPKIRARQGLYFTLVILTTLLSVYLGIVQGPSLRYTSGAQTGLNGVILILARALLTGVALVFVTNRNLRYRLLIGSFIIFSSLIQIDGFAMALTFICIVGLIYYNIGNVILKYQFLLISIFTVLLSLYLAFIAKFGKDFTILTLDLITNYIIPRFAVQAHQLYQFVSGELQASSWNNNWNNIFADIMNKLSIIFTDNKNLIYPRSISEALHLDMYGSLGAGSSPGFMLNTLLMFPFSFLLTPLHVFFFGIIASAYHRKISVIEAGLICYVTKPAHNYSIDFVSLISPNFIYFLIVTGLLLFRFGLKNESL